MIYPGSPIAFICDNCGAVYETRQTDLAHAREETRKNAQWTFPEEAHMCAKCSE